MDNTLLFRDLKMESLLDIMCGDSHQLRDICRIHLRDGLHTATEIYDYQNKLKNMIYNETITEKIYQICDTVNEAAFPYRNFLHPRNASSLTPQKKLDAYLRLVFLMGDGLCEIYNLQNDFAAKEKLTIQIDELKKISLDNDRIQYILAGKYGEGLHATNIYLQQIDYEKEEHAKQFFSFSRTKSKKYLCEGVEFSAMTEDIQRLHNSVAYTLIHIIAAFEANLRQRLLKIQNDYGFGLGGIQLWKFLISKGIEICYPRFTTDAADRKLCFKNLVELSVIINGESAVPNTVDLAKKQIILITGANQGGKTTFLRSIGQAQLLAQSGMFVAAESFETEMYSSIYTHFPDEKDKYQKSGLLDQELVKLEEIIKQLQKNSLLLMNESFLTTTEYIASQISTEIMNGFLMSGVKTFFVTHNYSFSKKMYECSSPEFAFLKACIDTDQKRTFKIVEGSPERSAYAEKLYEAIVNAN